MQKIMLNLLGRHEQETLIYIIQQHQTSFKMIANHMQQVEFNKVEYTIRIRFAISFPIAKQSWIEQCWMILLPFSGGLMVIFTNV